MACQTAGAVSLEFSNVLHLDSGPLVWLDHAPVQDEPVGIGLTNVTLRDAGPVLECQFAKIPARPGSISIRANGSAFVIRPSATLLSFSGPTSPERLLSTLYWTGQGSLVSPQTVIAGWRRADGKTEVLDDAQCRCGTGAEQSGICGLGRRGSRRQSNRRVAGAAEDLRSAGCRPAEAVRSQPVRCVKRIHEEAVVKSLARRNRDLPSIHPACPPSRGCH